MAKEESRRVISDGIWKQLEGAIKQAKHSQAGAAAELSERDFLEAVLYLNRVGCPWRDLPEELGSLAPDIREISALGGAWGMGPLVEESESRTLCPSP